MGTDGGEWARTEERSSRFTRLEWYEEQWEAQLNRTGGVIPRRKFGPGSGAGRFARFFSGVYTALVEAVRHGLRTGVWGILIDPRDSLIGHGGSRTVEAAGVFSERQCTALVMPGASGS